ncbi:hypothetical protein SLEP1_g45585 [Rubroshorea leprosula]|uniref:CCHC-type domain-containing protein n=1 Tax=Rubroshorea leprosula TaxID=152421 RepID=A0AAV5LJJ1_9ROSI|nr:hypothetical protein SLEP1_g45585 [Rubroshorea leprosula]
MATHDESPNSAASKTSPNSVATVLNPGLTKNPLSFNFAAFPVKLTPTNYMSWGAQFTSLLAGYELDGYLDGRNPCPVATALEYSLWARQNQLLRHALITTVSENITPYIAAAATAQQAWETLARLYANRSRSRVITLKERLQNMRRDGRFSSSTGLLFPLMTCMTDWSRPEITPVTAHYAAASFNFSTDSSSSLSAGNSNSSLGRHPPQAFCGNRNGQNSSNRGNQNQCHNFGPKPTTRPTNSGCQLCGPAGHFARNCPNYRVQALGSMANLASSSAAFFYDCLLDSGANNHVTTELANLVLHFKYNGHDELHSGDGIGLKITHVRHSTLSTSQSSLSLRNVYPLYLCLMFLPLAI